jgi:hypothetical protein
MESAVAVDQVIQKNLSQLQKPGVLFIRPGYKSVKGQVKDIPAIVVTVEDKRKGVPARDRVPAKIGPYPTDVRQASPMHLLRASDPDLWAEVADAAPPELQRPIFPFERDATGQFVEPILEAAAAKVAASKSAKKPIPYTPPDSPKLRPVTDTFTLTCHASPDAGWPTLESFLNATKDGLTVAMYEFTAPYIVDSFLKNLKGKNLELVLDDPSDPTVRDQTEVETHDQLTKGLGKSLSFAWALENDDPHVSAEIFPKAYHIKVIVRDSSAFWLSSGNLNRSNQPDIDPINDLAAAKPELPACDRDWHVIVENSTLAKVFEAFLKNDFTVASENQLPEGSDSKIVRAALAAMVKNAKPKSKIPVQFFAPKSITAKMKVEPVLTPDNFAASIIPQIRKAKKTFVMQTQYINLAAKIPSSPTSVTRQSDLALQALAGAISELIKGGKVDVRLILSEHESQDKIELLHGLGITQKFIKIQNGVHNKGIIVDSSVVVVGSQNWSPQGVSRNRDASVIIHNADAAKYWGQIFDHDWDHMAQASSPD